MNPFKKSPVTPVEPLPEEDIMFEMQIREQMERLATYRHVRRSCSILVGIGVACLFGLNGNTLFIALIIGFVFHLVSGSTPWLPGCKKK